MTPPLKGLGVVVLPLATGMAGFKWLKRGGGCVGVWKGYSVGREFVKRGDGKCVVMNCPFC